jgi:hypothetical protein
MSRRRRVFARVVIESLEPRRLFNGTGLTGQYFDNMDFTTPRTTRVDATINFNWGTAAPAANVAADTFSVRWTGSLQAQFSELYTFFVNGDDGYRLWINDQMVLNNMLTQSAIETSGQIALRAGQSYNVRLEYFDNTSTAMAQLSWSSPSLAKQIIPQSRLYPTAVVDDRGSALSETWGSLNGNTVATLRTNTGFLAGTLPTSREYLNRLESVASDWGVNFGTKVSGYIVPDATGPYRFAISGSSDAQLNLNTTGGVGNTTHRRIAFTSGTTGLRQYTLRASQQSATVNLTAGVPYYFEVWHKSGETGNHFSVAWQTPWAATAWTVVDGTFMIPARVTTAAPAVPAANQTGPNLFTNASTGRGRIMATNADWKRALDLGNSGGTLTTFRNNIITAADAVLVDALPVYIPGDSQQGELQDAEADLMRLTAAFKLTGNTVYADRAFLILKTALQWSDWGTGLAYGMGGNGAAFAYDHLYDYLAALDTSADPVLNGTPAPQWLADRMVALIVNPAIATLRAGNSWAGWDNNWIFIATGGAIQVGLAIAPLYTSTTSELIARSIPEIRQVIDRTMETNGGGSEEGPGYNTYGGGYLFQMLPSLVNTFGHDFGISRTAGLNLYPNFMFGEWGGAGAMAMYSEGQWTQIFEPWNFYFATRFGRTDTAWFIRDRIGTTTSDPLALLWWDERGASPATMAYRTEHAAVNDTSTFRSEQVHTTRETWSDPTWQEPALFYKGGFFDNRHDTLDAGHWSYYSQGKLWFPTMYASDYGLPGYGSTSNLAVHPNRWDYYANRAESRNTLVINGNLYSGSDQVAGSNNTVIRSLSNSSETVALVDLTPAYATQHNTPSTPRVSKLWRGFRFDKRTGMNVVQDEITPASGVTLQTVDWFATIPHGRNPTFSNGNRDVMLADGSARLYMRILSPAAATFQVVGSRSLWTGPDSQFLNPAGNINYDASWDRLNIRLSNVSAATTLTVAMWGNWGTGTPPFPATASSFATGWLPRPDTQVWLGDIDGNRAGDAADVPAIDAVWSSQVSQSITNRTRVNFDSAATGTVVPFTFNFPANTPGQSISSAKLVMSLRNTGNSTSTNDLLYLNSISGPLSFTTAFGSTAAGRINSTGTVVEYPLSSTLLSSIGSAGRLNLAVSGNTSVDWAYLSFDRTSPPSAPAAAPEAPAPSLSFGTLLNPKFNLPGSRASAGLFSVAAIGDDETPLF